MRRSRKINTHNPLDPLPDRWMDYILLAPHRVREALEAYDNWTVKRDVPRLVKELMLVLCVELEQYDNRRSAESQS